MGPPFCRISPPSQFPEVAAFLADNQYPWEWTPSMLAASAVVRVFDDQGDIGYFWGQWVDSGVLGIHVCISLLRRQEWQNPALLDRLYQIAFWLGADELAVSLDGAPNPRLLRFLLTRNGFRSDEDAPHIYIKNLWNQPDGQTHSTNDRPGRREEPDFQRPL